MERDTRNIIIASLLMAAAVLLQSTLLTRIAIRGARPDLALIVLVFVSLRKGSMVGQVSGFASGLTADLLSLSPLGFQAALRTLLGFLYGLFRGTIFLDPILMPLAGVAVATLLKALLSGLLMLVFSIPGGMVEAFGVRLWIELGYNAVLAPFLFAGLGLVRPLKEKDREVL